MSPEDQIRMLMQEIASLKAQLAEERAAQYEAARPPQGSDKAPKRLGPQSKYGGHRDQYLRKMPSWETDKKPGPATESGPYIRKELKPGEKPYRPVGGTWPLY